MSVTAPPRLAVIEKPSPPLVLNCEKESLVVIVNVAEIPAVANVNPIPDAVLLDAHFHEGRTSILSGEFEKSCPEDLTSMIYSPVSKRAGQSPRALTPFGVR
jgi:hypothetical protein